MRSREAVETMFAHQNAAAASAPVEEPRRLKLLADSLYSTAIDSQLLAARSSPATNPRGRPRA
ncbi:hypothetical protein DM819_08405 [Pseudomonas hunanensis]|uniref:Uncharacterized protein n=1 Tax=Pseudomonas hunanensis TaxID=1247546 RepID=A0ABD6MXL4_9PSED|nr:hypothetical protein [Pseudomonas hunanensis]